TEARIGGVLRDCPIRRQGAARAPPLPQAHDQVGHRSADRQLHLELVTAGNVTIGSEEESLDLHNSACAAGSLVGSTLYPAPAALFPAPPRSGAQPAPDAPGPSAFCRTSSGGASSTRNCDSSWWSREVDPRTTVRPSLVPVPIISSPASSSKEMWSADSSVTNAPYGVKRVV